MWHRSMRGLLCTLGRNFVLSIHQSVSELKPGLRPFVILEIYKETTNSTLSWLSLHDLVKSAMTMSVHRAFDQIESVDGTTNTN